MDNKGLLSLADIYLNKNESSERLIDLCLLAIKESRMTVAGKLCKEFKPQGLTALWLLEESHFSIHTYPENNYISVDCYTCGGEGNPVEAIKFLIDRLDVKKSTVKTIERG